MMEVAQAAAFFGRPALAMLMIAVSAWVFGRTLCERLGFDLRPREDRALIVTLGLAVMAQALFLLGIARLLYPSLLLALLISTNALCHKTWARLRDELHVGLPSWLLPALLVASPVLLLELYPETGFDATNYHLPFVRAFLGEHALVFVPELRFPVFPQACEMLFLLSEILGGDQAAKWIELLSVLLTADILYFWGNREFSPRVGAWAAALWLGTPLVIWIGSMAYVDATLVLFVTAALSCWRRSRAVGYRWQLAAGFLVGMAAGTKYLGLFFCAILGVLALRGGARRATLLALVLLVSAGPWYFRLLYSTGNPVFPFCETLFGSSEWTSPVPLQVETASSQGLSESLADTLGPVVWRIRYLLFLPWNSLFGRDIFHHVAPFSPWLLVLVPFLLLAWRERKVRPLILLVAMYTLVWIEIPRDLRFLLPVLPPLYLALAVGVDRLWPRRAPAAALTLLLLAPGPAYAAYKVHERGRPPVSTEAVEDYLSRQVPGYECLQQLNHIQGESFVVYALGGERLRHFARGQFLGDTRGPYRHDRVARVADDPDKLARLLHGFGASHLLVDSKIRQLPRTAAFATRFDLLYQCGDGFQLYEIRSHTRSAHRLGTQTERTWRGRGFGNAAVFWCPALGPHPVP